MKKLIPLLDFVLEQEVRMSNPEIFKSKVYAYTNFLKQPLVLGMFVPCDEEGNVLDVPAGYEDYLANEDSLLYAKNYEYIQEYVRANEKVLFEGWTHEDRYGWVQNHELGLEINTETGTLAIFHENGIGYGYVKKVEDLVSYALTLTPSALEAIGIKE